MTNSPKNDRKPVTNLSENERNERKPMTNSPKNDRKPVTNNLSENERNEIKPMTDTPKNEINSKKKLAVFLKTLDIFGELLLHK